MSHEITVNSNGRAEAAYRGEKGWHGLGQELQVGASVEEWAAAAGMDWKALRSKVRYATDKEGSILEFPSQHVLFRSDTKAPLAVVSANYKVVQPIEALEFFRDLSDFELSFAGTLKGGRKYWATAELGEQTIRDRNDKVRAFLLFATGCDMKTIIKFVATRTVCNNTLMAALGENYADGVFEVSHRSEFDMAKAKAALGISARDAFASYIAEARRQASVKVDSDAAKAFIAKLFGEEKVEKVEDHGRGYQKVMELFNGAAIGYEMAGSTAWGLMNAVTEYADHHIGARSDDNRADSAMFGPGAALKTRAQAMAAELV